MLFLTGFDVRCRFEIALAALHKLAVPFALFQGDKKHEYESPKAC